jgi:hypothetical protein
VSRCTAGTTVKAELSDRMLPVPAARAFVESEFEDAEVAIVSGSFIRGEDTRAFDLDLFVVKKWSIAKPAGPPRYALLCKLDCPSDGRIEITRAALKRWIGFKGFSVVTSSSQFDIAAAATCNASSALRPRIQASLYARSACNSVTGTQIATLSKNAA